MKRKEVARARLHPDDLAFIVNDADDRVALVDETRLPCDGRTMGELEVRGPWIAAGYFNRDDCGDRFTADGWFRTGDIMTIDGRWSVTIQDRARVGADGAPRGCEAAVVPRTSAGMFQKTALRKHFKNYHPD